MTRSWLTRLCGLIALAFLALFLFYPLVVILLRSLTSWDAALGALTNPFYRERLGFTAYQALLSTALTVLIGLPSALLFEIGRAHV